MPAANSATAPSAGALVAALAGGAVAAALAVFQPVAGLAAALVVLAVVAAASLPVTRLGVALVLAAAVAALLGPNLAPPGASWLFAFRVLIVLVLTGAAAWLLMGRPIAVPRPIGLPVALLGLWLIWSAVTIAWAGDPLAGLRWTAFLAMMSGLTVGLALVCRTPRRARILLWSLLGVFVLALLVAAAEVATGMHLPTARPGRDATTIFGAASLFGNQNNFATFLTLSLPYFAVLPLAYRDIRLRLLGLAGVLATLVALLYTGSKANLIAAGLVLIAILLILGADRRTRGRIVAAGAVAALAALLVIPSIQGGGVVKLPEQGVTKFDFGLLAAQRETGTGSGALRSSLTEDGLGLITSTRGRGVGAGNAEVRVRAMNPDARVTNLHNWWLEVTVNGGLVALALFALFYFWLLLGQLRAARRARTRLVRYLTVAGAAALVGFFAGSIGPSTAIHFAPMWLAFALGMIGLVLARREVA